MAPVRDMYKKQYFPLYYDKDLTEDVTHVAVLSNFICAIIKEDVIFGK